MICFYSNNSTKMMCHMARDALHYGQNARMHHCFGDEDGMQWLKRHLVVNSKQISQS